MAVLSLKFFKMP